MVSNPANYEIHATYILVYSKVCEHRLRLFKHWDLAHTCLYGILDGCEDYEGPIMSVGGRTIRVLVCVCWRALASH